MYWNGRSLGLDIVAVLLSTVRRGAGGLVVVNWLTSTRLLLFVVVAVEILNFAAVPVGEHYHDNGRIDSVSAGAPPTSW